MAEQVDTWAEGDPYERFVGRWSRVVAPLFVEFVDAPAGARWLDVGCGTGALSAAILEHARPASVVAVEPSDGFAASARARLGDRVQVLAGAAERVPLADAAVDLTVSGLVLNFVADPGAGLAEMRRVTRPGGLVGAYVWDYAGRMEVLRLFWEAAVAVDPAAAPLHEGVRFPGCTPPALAALFHGAGLEHVATRSLEVAATFADFDDYWVPFLGGQGPAPTWVASLDDAGRERLETELRARVPVQPDGTVVLAARAWGVRGIAPG